MSVLPGWRVLVLVSLVVVSIFAVVIAAGLGLAIWFGAVPTLGTYIDWNGVTAIATVVSAVATVLLLASLAFTALDFDRRARDGLAQEAKESQRERVARRPYIRADIAFADRHEPSFRPPRTEHVFSLEELGLSDAAARLAEVDSASTWESFDLVLWLTNLQSQPLGIADKVTVDLIISWKCGAAETEVRAITLTFAYLAPGQTTAVRLCRPPASIQQFSAEVLQVDYADIFDERAGDSHGAMAMVYDRGKVRNERRIERPPVSSASAS